MKIDVKNENRRFHLALPNWLILNRVSLRLVRKGTKGEVEIRLSGKALRELRRAVKRLRRTRGDWSLIEVHSADGDEVRVRL